MARRNSVRVGAARTVLDDQELQRSELGRLWKVVAPRFDIYNFVTGELGPLAFLDDQEPQRSELGNLWKVVTVVVTVVVPANDEHMSRFFTAAR